MRSVSLSLRLLFFVLVFSFGIVSPPSSVRAIAQEAGGPAFVQWDSIASLAESVLETRLASNVALGELRGKIVEWRAVFVMAQSTDQSRINSMRAQLDALGPVPKDGATEIDSIATRRNELNAQLNRFDAPQRAANEAYIRADGIVTEIDDILRIRQSARLSELGPSPLNFTHWPAAYIDLLQSIEAIGGEVSQAWSSDTQQERIRQALPLVISYLVLGVVFLTQGRRRMENLTKRVQAQARYQHRGVLAFGLSLGQVFIPVIGIVIIAEALFATKLLGIRGQAIAEALPFIGLAYYGARWLSFRLFQEWENHALLLGLNDKQRGDLRIYTGLLGICLGFYTLLSRFHVYVDFSSETYVILEFPILILTSFLLFCSGKILVKAPSIQQSHFDKKGMDIEEVVEELRPVVMNLAGRVLMIVGITAPILTIIGYFNAAIALIYPTLLTAALFGFLLVLQAVARQVFTMVAKLDDAVASEALFPVVINFVLTIISLPLFALVWGVRVTDMTELWARFSEGISIGDTRISPSDFLLGAIVFAFVYGGTRLIQGTLRTTILPKTKLNTGRRIAIVSGVGYIGVFLSGLIGITVAGVDLSKLAIVAGALSIGVGFGLQNIVSNFVSGIILLIERPISEGDWIEAGDKTGIVKEISVRSTRIETFDHRDVIIPNADLVSGVVTNWTRSNLLGRIILPVGVAYGTDTRKIEKILVEIVEATPMVSRTPAPSVVMTGFGADSMNFEVRAIIRNVNLTPRVTSDLLHEIARRFTEEGIEIPFPQRDIWLRNPETLQSVTPTEGETT